MRNLLVTLLLLIAAVHSRASGTLIIGNKGEDTLSYVDLADGRQLARPKTGPNPHEVAVSPDGSQAAVVAYGGHTVDAFDIAKRGACAHDRSFAEQSAARHCLAG